MSLFTKIQRWIQEEKRYVWIVITLVLLHTTFSLIATLTIPSATAPSPQKEALLAEEARLVSALKENESLQFVLGIGTLLGLLILSFGLFLTIRFVKAKRQGKWVIPWRLPDQEVTWTLRDVFHVVVLLVVAGYLIEIFQLLFFQIFKQVPQNIRLLGGTFLTEVIALYLIFRLVFQKNKTLSHLGLTKNALSRNLLFGFRSYVSLLPFLGLTLVLSLWLAEVFNLTPTPQPIQHLFQEESSQKIFFVGLILVLFVGPVVEEIFFRGFLYNALKAKWGKGWAIFSSGFLFAILHANLIGLLPITLLGCTLAYVYALTGSLTASITIHILHNSIVMAIFFFVTHLTKMLGAG